MHFLCNCIIFWIQIYIREQIAFCKCYQPWSKWPTNFYHLLIFLAFLFFSRCNIHVQTKLMAWYCYSCYPLHPYDNEGMVSWVKLLHLAIFVSLTDAIYPCPHLQTYIVSRPQCLKKTLLAQQSILLALGFKARS